MSRVTVPRAATEEEAAALSAAASTYIAVLREITAAIYGDLDKWEPEAVATMLVSTAITGVVARSEAAGADLAARVYGLGVSVGSMMAQVGPQAAAGIAAEINRGITMGQGFISPPGHA